MFLSRPRRLRVAPIVCLAVVSVLSGCANDPSREAKDTVMRLGPAQFAAVIDAPGTFTLNVHTPDEGSIRGTDATIPFDRLRARVEELPADRSTPIAVYCRTGNMSAVATVTLSELGYFHVTELEGGMEAWQDDGRNLVPPG